MNWFTHKIIEKVSDELKAKYIKEDTACEHCEENVHLAYALRRENDSFGPVSSYVCCKACDELADMLADIEVGKEEVICHDCSQTHEKKDTIEWKWYDFYAAQGDEPIIICNSCWTKEKHIKRVKQDRENYEREMRNH